MYPLLQAGTLDAPDRNPRVSRRSPEALALVLGVLPVALGAPLAGRTGHRARSLATPTLAGRGV